MKKLSIMNGFILGLTTLSLLTTGCEKESLETWNKTQPTPSAPKQSNSGGNQTQSQMLFATNGPKYKYYGPTCGCCIDLRGNCIGDIIINGTTESLREGQILVFTTTSSEEIQTWYQELDNHIQQNTVSTFFGVDGNGRNLFPHITGKALQDLQAGITTINKWGGNNGKYLILYPNATSHTDGPVYED